MARPHNNMTLCTQLCKGKQHTVKHNSVEVTLLGWGGGQMTSWFHKVPVSQSQLPFHNLDTLISVLDCWLCPTDYLRPRMFLLLINLVPTKASLSFNIVVRILPRVTLSWWLLRFKQLPQKVLTQLLPLWPSLFWEADQLDRSSTPSEPRRLGASRFPCCIFFIFVTLIFVMKYNW